MRPSISITARTGGISFRDAFRFRDAGRTVTVANARAAKPYEVRHEAGPPTWIAICAVELPAAFAPGLVQQRRYHPMPHLRYAPTAYPMFDQRFLAAVPDIGAGWLTPATIVGGRAAVFVGAARR